MVVTFPANQASSGLRRINPNKDLPQVVDLLQLVFGQEMQAEGQYWSSVVDSQNPAFLWRFDPSLTRLTPGFIWEIDNKIIGNVTLLPTKLAGRYIIANVAVHPGYRRQGFARMLMRAAMQEVRNRSGREILLQVVSDNVNAVTLYQSLGFQSLGDMATWHSSVSRIRGLRLDNSPIPAQPLQRRKWREAYQLDSQVADPNLGWPEPIAKDFYRMTIWRRLTGYINGYQLKTFVTMDDNAKLNGLASILSEWGRPHEIAVRVIPEKSGELEQPLLNQAIQLLRNLSRRNIRLIHNAHDAVMNELLPALKFDNKRILTHMRFVV